MMGHCKDQCISNIASSSMIGDNKKKSNRELDTMDAEEKKKNNY